MNMSTQLLYNDFPTFLRKYFPYKVQKISLNAVSLAPIVMVQKDGVDVLTAITRLLIRIIVGQRNLLLFNWKKVNAFLPINIRK